MAASLDIVLPVHRVGVDLHDPGNRFPAVHGIGATGATLVRPDGFAAWRAGTLPRRPAQELQQVLAGLLARSAHNG
ncbi:MAG: hypothetical protein WCA46_05675 [Actinocatenispora sp.]